MRVSVFEVPARWGFDLFVFNELEDRLAESPTDLALLPETALTGYVSPKGEFDLSPFAETRDGVTAQLLSALAKKHRTTLVGPLVLREGDRRFNAMAAYGPNGEELFVYKKRNPWYPESWATPGTEQPPLVEIAGVKTTICICFDLHFVSKDCGAVLDAADLLLFPAAWTEVLPGEPLPNGPVDSRLEHFKTLTEKHRVAIAHANWSRGVVRLPGQGGSRILAPDGKILGHLAPSKERQIRRLDTELFTPPG